jgi:hypothetical protein
MELARQVQELHDRELAFEYEKRERLTRKIIELEQENHKLRGLSKQHVSVQVCTQDLND